MKKQKTVFAAVLTLVLALSIVTVLQLLLRQM